MTLNDIISHLTTHGRDCSASTADGGSVTTTFEDETFEIYWDSSPGDAGWAWRDHSSSGPLDSLEELSTLLGLEVQS